jgi:hypothetical protein
MSESTNNESKTFYVVSDASGFVGAFNDINAVIQLTKEYKLIPFITQRFRVSPDHPDDHIWTVLYSANDVVAFASNDRNEAILAQKTLNTLGLSYPDDIDYWRHNVNSITKSAEERLKSISRAHEMYASAGPDTQEDIERAYKEDLARIEALLNPNIQSPIERYLKEKERITIFDCVIPVAIGGPPDVDSTSVDSTDAEPSGDSTDVEPSGDSTDVEPTDVEPPIVEPTDVELLVV